MKVIAIANQKGGVGKTSTTIEISAALTEMGYKVLMIDFDQQCNLTSYVGAKFTGENIFTDLVASKEQKPISEILKSIQKGKMYDVIPASEMLSKADNTFSGADIFLLADVIEQVGIEEKYDYVLIDNSPARNILLTMSYIAADGVIVPTECDDGSLVGIKAVDKDIRELRDTRRPLTCAYILGIVLTKVENTKMHMMAQEYLESVTKRELINDPFIETVRKSIIMSQCKLSKKSLQEEYKWSPLAIDYRRIAEKIVERMAP